MHLEEALNRIQEIVEEIENKQLPLHEIMKLHEEGQSLIAHSEKLLVDAKERLKVTEVQVDSSPSPAENNAPERGTSDSDEINLF